MAFPANKSGKTKPARFCRTGKHRCTACINVRPGWIANTCKSFALILSRDTLVDRVFYQSTRGGVRGVSFEEAVLTGYAPDGGLLVPELVPLFTAGQLRSLAGMNFAGVVAEVVSNGRFGSAHLFRFIIHDPHQSITPTNDSWGVRVDVRLHHQSRGGGE